MNKLLIFLFIGVFSAFGFSNTPGSKVKTNKSNINKRHNKLQGKVSQKNLSTAYPLLRLKLILDAYNSDDIAIGFNAAGTIAYNNQLDSRYMPGIDAPEGLSCLSSDSVQLSVSILPYPKQSPIIVKLDVEAANSGSFTLQKTELDTIPAIYDFWLIDNYKKDSVNLRTTTNYFFSVDKTKSASFGNTRFEVVIRQNTALSFKLLSFSAIKSSGKADVAWITSNEQENTGFAVQRSIDGGINYYILNTIESTGTGSYSYIDTNPVTGTDTYRLKITDANSSVTYSNLVPLIFAQQLASENNLKIYPNPSISIINLTIGQSDAAYGGSGTLAANTETSQGGTSSKALSAGSYTIKILNITGSVLSTSTSSSATWQGYISTFLPGTYVIRVTNNVNNSLVGSSTFVKL